MQATRVATIQDHSVGPHGLIPGPICSAKLRALGAHFPDDLSGERVLDVGCNHGFFSILAAERGAKSVVAVDTSAKALGAAGQYLRQTKRAISSRVHLVTSIPYQKFDLILALGVIHHLFRGNRSHSLTAWEFADVLDFAGRMVMEVPGDNDSATRAMFPDGEWVEGDLRYAMEQWFSIEDIGPTEHVQGRRLWLLRHRT